MAEMKKVATRDSYGNALKELGAEFENLVVLDADLAGATKTGVFMKAFPERHFDAIEAALNEAKTVKGQPTAIVMKTVKGKDVSYMENNAGWHGKARNDAEYAQAMSELKAQLAELEA